MLIAVYAYKKISVLLRSAILHNLVLILTKFEILMQ